MLTQRNAKNVLTFYYDIALNNQKLDIEVTFENGELCEVSGSYCQFVPLYTENLLAYWAVAGEISREVLRLQEEMASIKSTGGLAIFQRILDNAQTERKQDAAREAFPVL